MQRYGLNKSRRVNYNNSRATHPNPKKDFVPRQVLMRTGLKTVDTARPFVKNHPRPLRSSFKSHSKRSFNKYPPK